MELFTQNLTNHKIKHNKIENVLILFFNLINNADNYVKNKRKDNYLTHTINKINNINDIPKSSMNNSYLFPNEIQQYINNNSLYNINFNCKIKGRLINVDFIIFNKMSNNSLSIINNQIHMIFMWIYILQQYSLKKCSKYINLFVYFTPFTKILPNNRLTSINSTNVNSGFTTGCKEFTEIVLYRTEEWFKVFIHETFHNFGLDFSDINLYTTDKKLKEIFNLNIEYNLYESYCETWARIWNTLFYSYFAVPYTIKPNSTMFISNFYKNIKIEAQHSLIQMLKILQFHDLNYSTITNKQPSNITICNHLYSEQTSVFSYYIITSLLINNFDLFIIWCDINNNNIIQFKKTPNNLDKYIELIKKCEYNKHLKNNINKIEKSFIKNKEHIDDNLKMTYINMYDVFEK